MYRERICTLWMVVAVFALLGLQVTAPIVHTSDCAGHAHAHDHTSSSAADSGDADHEPLDHECDVCRILSNLSAFDVSSPDGPSVLAVALQPFPLGPEPRASKSFSPKIGRAPPA